MSLFDNTSVQNAKQLLETYERYMVLRIYVDNENYPELKQKYIVSATNHNNKMLNKDNQYLDSGFDLFNPAIKKINEHNLLFCSSYGENKMNTVNKIDFAIICSAQMVTDNKTFNTSYYTHPRSSLSKTKLRLANATGIIDAGYRGNIIGMFDMINLCVNEEYIVSKYDRLLQICAPGLVPIVVEIVDSFEQLGKETERGSGSFGSTGV